MKSVHFLKAAVAAAVLFTACADTTQQVLVPAADVVTADEHRVTPTRTTKAAQRTSAVIDQNGGSLSIGGHTLTVPAGAVGQATIFSMQIVEAQAVHVKLRAWRQSDGAAVTQFPNVPVTFTASVADVAEVDLSGLVIVYLRDGTYNGTKEVVRSSVDMAAKTVTGWLTHFSDYAVAKEMAVGID